MTHHFIEVKNVHYSYPDGNKALNGIDFRINYGETVGIVGANGAGKSTLLNIILGVFFPSKGEINIGDIPLTKKNLPLIRQKVGLVFQNADDQLFMPTVYDDVAFGLRNFKLEEKEVERRVIKALQTVGILHLKDKAPYRLSEGEKRAAAIACVISMEPDILIMDEPTTSLDPKARRRLINFLKEFNHMKVIASHDMDMIWELCERTIVIKEGTIIADGLTKEILSNENLMEESSLELPLRLQK
ncbi:cobalt/nickel transport system ATP-binding protein [Clostridium sp. USBA 49]|jgi:cobalt/nickel transport system ATP-binding protein|uniref:energy-coupling factor ABC transporter ATP-binding protein n=1 Tax=Clostridium sp. USBA 49 TaxID=1881060 RepID=UPI00099940FD|nr:ABC transporter ATP-binding protein [Clostridium sp. USBA 49]SKA73868.1 cobalt/nickel transport system ATP-binding protein [Clostridium sp. USBA 49]